MIIHSVKTDITSFIKSISNIPPDVLELMLAHFQHLELPKHYYLLKQERPCAYLWFMLEGAVRYFYTDEEGREVNVWFSLDQDIVTDVPAFVHQTSTQISIQLLEDSELYALSYQHLQQLLQNHHAFALWYIKMIEKYYISQVEERIDTLQFLNAAQRYHKLLADFPGITQRISLGHIASFLNITQETLSRIRAGKM
ncbi:MAG: Crp/Fnr family transcriptional regulator [Saprospiraceae bacterium]